MDLFGHLPSLRDLPAWWWTLLALCIAGFALLRVFLGERPNAARERALRAALDECGGAESASEHARLEHQQDAPREARQRAAPGPAGPPAPYRTPWYLFLGDRAADVPKLLSAARDATPLNVTGVWRWTALRAMFAIAVAPEVVESPGAPRTRRAWHHALLTLAQERDRLPLNGIVLCVGVRQLLQARTAVASDAARLRRRVDDVASRLRLRLPVYVVVTGLETLDGYDTVRAALPAEVLAQVVGHRVHNDKRTKGDEVITAVFARLHALRMALLRAHPDAADRLDIHRFIEALRETEAGLSVLAKELFDHRVGRPTAQPCRGFYLAAARAAGGAFVDDLFEHFLPVDQPLARAA